MRQLLSRLDPLLQETLVAAVAMACLATLVAVIYWVVTGVSPWPGLVLGLIAGFGFGTALLAMASPRRRG